MLLKRKLGQWQIAHSSRSHCALFCGRYIYDFGDRDRTTLKQMLVRSANYGTRSRSRDKNRWSWCATRFSRITISRRRRHDTRYAHAFHRAKAIFRSNMIIKSNGIRNSSAARILSTSSPLCTSSHPVAPLVVCCDPLTFSPRMGQGMRFAILSSFYSLSPSFPFRLFLSKHTDTSVSTSGNQEGASRKKKKKCDGKRRNI